MATLKEIAADVGVSHTLVSRVLNNRMGTARVGQETRDAILRRAQETNYRPNPLAIALKRGRKGAVGVFIHRVGVEGSNLGLRFLEAVSSALAKAHMNLCLQFFQSDAEFLAACNPRLTRNLDGLIITGVAHPELATTLVNLQKQGLHIVCTYEREFYSPDLICIGPDQPRQNYLTTQHLLATGCRRIVHFDTISGRTRGYLQALAEANVPVDPALIKQLLPFTSEAGYECTRQLLNSGIVFDGINAQSDAQAAGAMRCLSDRGIPVARWPKITGVDDSPIARYYSQIPLTSVTSGLEICASLAVEAILQRLGDKPAKSIIVAPELVVRASTVPDHIRAAA